MTEREVLAELVRLRDLKATDPVAYAGEGAAKERAWEAARIVLSEVPPYFDGDSAGQWTGTPSGAETECELPGDLQRVLGDPSITVRQDQGVFELLARWQKAPSPTLGTE